MTRRRSVASTVSSPLRRAGGSCGATCLRAYSFGSPLTSFGMSISMRASPVPMGYVSTGDGSMSITCPQLGNGSSTPRRTIPANDEVLSGCVCVRSRRSREVPPSTARVRDA
eukprot:Amastigsp_a179812_22.p4 type:complete len:112 gc:universal Amastigsp_a179812_22:986-651(-)